MIQSPNSWAAIREQIDKAEQRARAEGLDLKALADAGRDAVPRELAPDEALAERSRMLAETQGDRGKDAFERLIDGDELQPINYLPRGAVAARSVCRIELYDLEHRPNGYATGFLIAPGVLLTNNHVFPAAAAAKNSVAQFDVDPVWDKFSDVQYPVKFWKAAVARTASNELFAAGFVLDQAEVIAQYGIEATVEVPFGAFKTFQVPIEEIERLTGLKFVSGKGEQEKSLSDVDPLRAGSRTRVARRRRTTLEESTAGGPAVAPGYVPLQNRFDVVLD